MHIDVEIFTLRFWHFILGEFFPFVAFIILILVVKGDFQKAVKSIGSVIGLIKERYKRIIHSEKAIDKIRTEHINDLNKITTEKKTTEQK